jgi:hypothetical protein
MSSNHSSQKTSIMLGFLWQTFETVYFLLDHFWKTLSCMFWMAYFWSDVYQPRWCLSDDWLTDWKEGCIIYPFNFNSHKECCKDYLDFLRCNNNSIPDYFDHSDCTLTKHFNKDSMFDSYYSNVKEMILFILWWMKIFLMWSILEF